MDFEEMLYLINFEEYVEDFISHAYLVYPDNSHKRLSKKEANKLIKMSAEDVLRHKNSYLAVEIKINKIQDYVENEVNQILEKIN